MKNLKSKVDKSQIEAALILGANDFYKGIACIPCISKSCMSLVEINQHIKGATVTIMDAWQKGWTSANLAS